MLDCRAAAARVLAAVAADGQSLGRALAPLEPEVGSRDRALLRELCYGSLRWYPRLHGLVAPLLQKPLKKKDAAVLQLLVVGAYQLFYTRIPSHAAIGATVEACRALDRSWATGLVNGILRRLQREHETLSAQLPPHAADAHPEWLWRRIRAAWPEQAETVFAAGNAHPPMCLRVNRRDTTPDEYLQRLQDAGIPAELCALSSVGLRLANPCDIDALPGFVDGAVSVQDEAAQLSAPLLAPQPGERVLDACCAPGGKTGHLLEHQPGLAELWALDSDGERLRRVAENLARLRLEARLITGDAAQPDAWWDGRPFDRILLDAPCSGTGVIRRHPDIKLLRSPADIDGLARLQRQLLDALWPLLAPGGTLLYATCSILPAENSELVSAFLAATADAEEAPIDATWGLAQPVGRQLLPSPGGCDGFYYARLRKSAGS